MSPPNADDPLPTTDHQPAPASAGAEMTAAFTPGDRDTTAHPPDPEPERAAGAVAVPGYEVLGVLGRGGMGVVYRVRHLALKRIVALKMILAGGHAGPSELARFRLEAEAVARLQHPNIVQVFEVGQADGRPYCALELIEGGNLASKINARPLPAREAAKLVEALARAVQLAHSRNVVHRDLKPANILLTADGTPKITDFGLARQLDSDSGETQAGAVVGTPAYMAPEQAAGRAHEAGPAADIYALGAILYDCLTGRPPFQGSTVLETLDQVRTQEPLPPSQFAPRDSRGGNWLDLETICLKCLRKEPEKRYASAAELADDLVRYQHGEPILARPVGRLERGWRWCRRNPALASALATLGAVLVLASVVSTLFAIDARNKEAAAVEARNDLAGKHAELEQKNSELEQKQDELERTLARSWLSPLVSRSVPLTDAEVSALEQVAAQRHNRLALRFVREAVTDRDLTPRLRARAAYALHAAVGLDRRKRAEAERLLLAELASVATESFRQEDLAFAAATLGDLSPETEATAAAILLRAMNRTTDPAVLQYLAPGLSSLAARMEPGKGAVTLLQVMSQTNDTLVVQSLGQGLVAVAARLQPGDTAEAAALLSQVLSKTTDPIGLQYQAQALSALAARLEPSEAATAVATLTQTMTRTTDPYQLQTLAPTLSALAARLEPSEAAKAASTILQNFSNTTNPFTLGNLAPGLSALAGRLKPRQAAAVCSTGAATLLQVESKTTTAFGVQILAEGLSALAARMEPKEAAATLLQALGNTTQSVAAHVLAPALSALAARLEPSEAAAAVAMLTQTMTRTTDPFPLQVLAPSLSALADRLEPREAAEAAATILKIISKTTTPIALRALAQGLSALAERMGPKQAAAVCSTAAATLTQVLGKTKTIEPDGLRALAQGLSALAARLEAKEAAALCSSTAATLTQAISQTTSPLALQMLAEGLSALAARLEPTESAAVFNAAAATLTQAIDRTTDTLALRDLAQGLSALAGRLPPKEAGAVCSRSAATLTRGLGQATNPGALRNLAQGLSALAERMERREAAAILGPAAATLVGILNQTTQAGALQILAGGLTALADRMAPTEAARVCRPAAATLARAMSKTTDPNALEALAEGLSALADHLEPREADALCGPAAATVIQVMSKTTNPRVGVNLANGLSVLAARLEPGKSAAMLLQVISKTDPNLLRYLVPGLSAVLSHSDPTKDRQRFPGIAGTVGGSSGPWSLLTTPVRLQLALDPSPPLPAQTLVDILNDPLCVGKFRGLVLEQLARHYGRPFADQWEIVRFAEEQKLGLDFTTLPQRP